MTTLSTTGLVQNCLDLLHAGDASARGRLIEHCHERLRLLVRKMLRQYPNVHRWEETTDVYHNVFLRLDRALHNLGLATARDFFQLAAHHVRLELLDLARHHRHHPELWPEPPDTVQLDDDPQQMQAWELIHDHIKQLPDEERVLFDLLYYHGLTQPEAARVLGKPLSTVKKHWQRARLRLMDRLGDTTPF